MTAPTAAGPTGRAALLAPLRGTVLEVGPGPTSNLQQLDPGVHWIGLEPDTTAFPLLTRLADRLGRPVTLLDGVAEAIPMPDGSVDAVVGTYVLCSVDDVECSLAEIRRVLRPGGTYVYVEHVVAERGTWTRFGQRVWGTATMAECRPDRDTGTAIDAAGFADVQRATAYVTGFLGARIPVIAGHATA
ncbi:class I SAM-dependent methyltransferase [Georgenia halophila]|uniref:Class I SAM-dependent methyltransferase n=1 Tax=Georgenia halophila TaxID=620889 RepID=A0ABP8KTY3_9MICO